VFAATLAELDVATAMAPAIDDLRPIAAAGGNLLVLAYGKAARAMAQALVTGLPGARLRGLVVPPEPDTAPLPPFEVIAGGHPLPSAGSLAAGRRALELARSAAADETVVFLASGGGSAMLEQPIDDSVTLADLQGLHRALVGSGADIVAMNTVRKHVSAVKGGRLALAARAAGSQRTIVISDVPDRPGAAVASGPSTVDASTPEQCRAVLDRFELWSHLPARLRERLERGEVPPRLMDATAGMPPLAVATIACNRRARAAARAHLAALGVLAVDDVVDDTPCAHTTWHLLRRLDRLRRRHPGRVVAVVSGGELSVPLPAETGTGGRNQQFALHCARLIRGRRVAVLSAGTDGVDGNSPAAGAVVDGSTMLRARALGLDVHEHLRRFDAFPLLHALGDTVQTGPTGTNVRDLRICVARG
ncbi:MAG TPA: DUF4147 domain-containing protein, partial [Planctomycetota bacterium]|nr:DUF4147 domain-containing protein [Planctomycetota bacterium]